jgi:hypothetical protein
MDSARYAAGEVNQHEITEIQTMVCRKFAGYVVSGLIAAALMQPAAANLLTNAGFETGDTTGWTSSNPTLAHADNRPAFVHDGAWGGLLDSFLTPPGSNASLIQSVALPGAGTYAFGGWLRAFTVGSPSGVFDQIQISTFVSITSEGGTLGDSVANFSNFQAISIGSLTSASDWEFFSGLFNYTGPAGGTVLFNFNLQNGNNDVISVAAGDSFFLERVPEPGILALLGIALAGLGFARRKQH